MIFDEMHILTSVFVSERQSFLYYPDKQQANLKIV